MSTMTDRYIICDLCGNEWASDQRTFAKARQQARGCGWTQRFSAYAKRIDVCPRCREASTPSAEITPGRAGTAATIGAGGPDKED